MTAEPITVEARIRTRTGPNQAVPDEERWDQQTAPTYSQACTAIRDRMSADEIVLAWYVDRS